jgi:hypothetical protein
VSQPPTYNREFDFTSFQASSPSAPLPASHIDAELNRVKATIDQVLANIALIQRDDGAIANASIGLDQLAAGVTAGFNPASMWVTAHAYTTSDFVFNGQKLYHCLVAHTSGTFATDLAAGDWTLLADFSQTTSASTSQAGVVQLATDAQAQAKGSTSLALTASNLAALGATTSFAGFVQLATNAQAIAAAATNVAVTPANLAAAVAQLAAINVFTTDQYLRTTDASGNPSPSLVLDRNKASPAANDFIGDLIYGGRNSTGGTVAYADILGRIVDPVAGTEDASLLLRTMQAGVLTPVATLGTGVQVGTPSGGDKGAGTINAQNGVYDGGYRSGQVLLASGTLSSAGSLDVVLTSYTQFRAIRFVLENIQPATDGANLQMRLSTDGSTYLTAANYETAKTVANATAGTVAFGGGTGLTSVGLANSISNAANKGFSGDVLIVKPAATTLMPKFQFSGAYCDTGAGLQLNSVQGVGFYRVAQVTAAVRFLFSAGNIASGEYAVYGLT